MRAEAERAPLGGRVTPQHDTGNLSATRKFSSIGPVGQPESGISRIRHIMSWWLQPCTGAPMRDWILILSPIAAIAYFASHPTEFKAFMDWFARLIL
jgi:hypothetical protein